MYRSKTILVTGATGFLGRHLCNYFRRKGDDVRGLVRRTEVYPFQEAGVKLFKGDLPDRIDPEAFKGAEVVIHAAYYTGRPTAVEEARRVNRDGTLRVYEMSKNAGIKQFVFISSLSAHADAESYYGRSKYEIEKLLDIRKDLIIRPGLIIGSGDAGTFNRMKESVRKSGIIPIFDGGRQILQTVHVDDLCQAVDRALEKKLTGIFVVAETKGLEIRDFFKLVASKLNRRCRLIPLPMNLFLAVLRLFEKLRIPFPVSSENLLGLKQMKHMPSAGDLKKMGVEARPAEESLKILEIPDV